jgi:hypothetical protein
MTQLLSLFYVNIGRPEESLTQMEKLMNIYVSINTPK